MFFPQKAEMHSYPEKLVLVISEEYYNSAAFLTDETSVYLPIVVKGFGYCTFTHHCHFQHLPNSYITLPRSTVHL